MSEDKRQDDELELTGDSADEELMSDFKELFPEDEDSAELGEERDAAEALEELDAFLDDFEQGLGPIEGTAEEEGFPLELKEDELDLAVSEGPDEEHGPSQREFEELPEPEEASEPDDLVMDAVVAAESEPTFTAKREPELPLDEPLSAAAAGLAGAAAAQVGEPSSTVQHAAPGKGTLLLMIGSLVVAVLLSAVALWHGMGVTERLDGIEQRLSQLQQRTVVQAPADSTQMRAELQQLAQRVSELAVIIEGPISHLRQSNEESLAALSRRIEHLEQTITAPATTRTGKAPAAPSPASGTPSEKAGWVINLLSLSSQKDAHAEMERLRKAGVRVEVQQAVSEGKTWYRLRVPGFASYEGAKAYIDTVEKQAGVKNAWVAKE